MCIALGGSITGEHGVGLEKRAVPRRDVRPRRHGLHEAAAAHRWIPHEIANRGKMFADGEAPALTATDCIRWRTRRLSECVRVVMDVSCVAAEADDDPEVQEAVLCARRGRRRRARRGCGRSRAARSRRCRRRRRRRRARRRRRSTGVHRIPAGRVHVHRARRRRRSPRSSDAAPSTASTLPFDPPLGRRAARPRRHRGGGAERTGPLSLRRRARLPARRARSSTAKGALRARRRQSREERRRLLPAAPAARQPGPPRRSSSKSPSRCSRCRAAQRTLARRAAPVSRDALRRARSLRRSTFELEAVELPPDGAGHRAPRRRGRRDADSARRGGRRGRSGTMARRSSSHQPCCRTAEADAWWTARAISRGSTTAALVKVAVTPSRIHAARAAPGGAPGATRRYGAGGEVAWIGWPGALADARRAADASMRAVGAGADRCRAPRRSRCSACVPTTRSSPASAQTIDPRGAFGFRRPDSLQHHIARRRRSGPARRSTWRAPCRRACTAGSACPRVRPIACSARRWIRRAAASS